MELTWHKEFAKSWQARTDQGRMPHAVLLAGPTGVGKRAAARWITCRQLGIGAPADLPQHSTSRPQHADLHWISPAEDKTAIGIEQIRQLAAEMSLTSYAGGSKVAIIEPANAMTINACNGLLKTLEEPPGDALLILVADRTGSLPATIISRCQRIEFLPPGESEGLAWLDRLRPGANWVEALSLAGNAPLAALQTAEQLETLASMSRDFTAVASGRASAVKVAADWASLDNEWVLDWLARQVQQLIFLYSGGPRGTPAQGIDDSVLKRMDRRNLFCYLDTINRLRGQSGGSYNVQLALEGLLLDLADGLETCRQRLPEDGMQHMLMEK